MSKMWKEFKEFAFGGELIMVAVALVMALAIKDLVQALVEFIIMPIVGIVFGERSFDGLILTVNDSVILYGSFITALVAFVGLALAVFYFVVKPYRSYKARVEAGEEEPVPPAEDIQLLTEIRDAVRR